MGHRVNFSKKNRLPHANYQLKAGPVLHHPSPLPESSLLQHVFVLQFAGHGFLSVPPPDTKANIGLCSGEMLILLAQINISLFIALTWP